MQSLRPFRHVPLLTLLLTRAALAQGGPPLVTDDPGTPGDRHWEINAVIQWSKAFSGSVLQVPSFDINYGLGERVQLNLISGLVTAFSDDTHSTSGISVASAGTKWRFVDEERAGVAVSTYPRIDFHHPLAADAEEINLPGSRYFLPFEFSKEFGRWGINPEIGYAAYSQFPSDWVYGLAISYSFAKDQEMLFEVHGRSRMASGEQELLYNLGARYALRENLSLIGAAGRTFAVYADEARTWNFYAGFQFRN